MFDVFSGKFSPGKETLTFSVSSGNVFPVTETSTSKGYSVMTSILDIFSHTETSFIWNESTFDTDSILFSIIFTLFILFVALT